ncbi:uncharacterized protein SPAPADRAFT_141971 [Spathaspora passalidarum NRRL Y-27907]|uniref:Uncharacterized protein n=1 Tax=Spathaspora passalidarum (strain NRRL Y-27907 / 11-Y1) TaxID=619300 RepID=G3ASQ7_SPAPN|nr:uncharacterized protein SPAPADRAFT_141971 [Spathaspora passalidarum NRRL Y-27907]EGW31121.1 hypothetical protein SPAPADRAFT_141971 [Spathaspora passalidarum NRRL Y-27907]
MTTLLSARTATESPTATRSNSTSSSSPGYSTNDDSAIYSPLLSPVTSNTADHINPFGKRTGYSRRVSFNNLNPEIDESVIHQAIYNLGAPNYTLATPQSLSSGTHATNIESAFTHLSKPTSTYVPKKRLKLPDPPSKSILKNRVSLQQLEYNEENDLYNDEDVKEGATINYHEDVLEDPEPEPAASPTTTRRKSYAGMSDEELMALDPQFNTKSKHNLDQFKFDNQKTYYLSSSKRTSVGSAAAAAAALSKKVEYPTSNENNYKSISLTVKHDEYDSIKYNRTLLTVISGRRHTWNTTDWLFLINQDPQQNSSFLVDGDYLIIASLIPLKFLKEYGNKRKRISMDDYLYEKCSKLLNYFAEYFTKLNLKLKVTVEFVTDNEEDYGGLSTIKINRGEKYMLEHLYKQYQPTMVLIGNKSSNMNFKYPIKMASSYQEYLIRLSSYIMKYSTVPVIVVGNTTKIHHPEINKNNSSSTLSSIESYAPIHKTTTTEETRKQEYHDNLQTLNALDYTNPTKYEDLVKCISDHAFVEASNYLLAVHSKDDSLKIDEKIHSMYRSQATTDDHHEENPIYKVKSLISYDPEEELKNEQKRQQIKSKKIKSVKSNDSSAVSSSSSSSINNEKPKKTSFWKKLGFKK